MLDTGMMWGLQVLFDILIFVGVVFLLYSPKHK